MACLPGHPDFRVCLLSLPACLSGLPGLPGLSGLPAQHGLPAQPALIGLHGLPARSACLPSLPAFPVCLPSVPACLPGLPAWTETLPHSAIFHLTQHYFASVCRRVISIAGANYDIRPSICTVRLLPLLGQTIKSDILPFTCAICAVKLFPLLVKL